jgi:DNA-binding NtrC family response regulator
MRRLMAELERVAPSNASVLLLGETGTGKEVIAHALHEASPRAGAPFEVVDCGALMPTLIASELFGHERGAFTGADQQHQGAFERADGGTIFLDEIGELPEQLQVRLLGVLERRSFRRVGGTKPISVDVRIVAATHRDLRRWVNRGQFRQDLYYRLAVARLEIPPLRERTEDIPLLVEHFLGEMGVEKPVEHVVPGAVLETLKSYHWPGNVRELRNFVESALAFGETRPPAWSMEDAESAAEGEEARFLSVPLRSLMKRAYREARDAVIYDFQEVYFRDLLQRTRGNVARAAEAARMNRPHMFQILKRHGIRARAPDVVEVDEH